MVNEGRVHRISHVDKNSGVDQISGVAENTCVDENSVVCRSSEKTVDENSVVAHFSWVAQRVFSLLNALCSKAKQLRIVLSHKTRFS